MTAPRFSGHGLSINHSEIASIFRIKNCTPSSFRSNNGQICISLAGTLNLTAVHHIEVILLVRFAKKVSRTYIYALSDYSTVKYLCHGEIAI